MNFLFYQRKKAEHMVHNFFRQCELMFFIHGLDLYLILLLLLRVHHEQVKLYYPAARLLQYAG